MAFRAAGRAEVVPAEVVPREPSAGGGDAEAEAPRAPADQPDTPAGVRRRARGQLWAALMQRAFGFDVLACPRCGGRLRLIALIEEAAVVGRILQHLGVPTEIPCAASRPRTAAPHVGA